MVFHKESFIHRNKRLGNGLLHGFIVVFFRSHALIKAERGAAMDWHARVEETPAQKERDRSTLSRLSCNEHWPSGHQAYGVMATTRDVC